MKTKYIIVETVFGQPAATVFPEILQHNEVAKNQKVISAGFCQHRVHGPGWICWGMSTSLNIKSHPEQDEKILNNQIK